MRFQQSVGSYIHIYTCQCHTTGTGHSNCHQQLLTEVAVLLLVEAEVGCFVGYYLADCICTMSHKCEYFDFVMVSLHIVHYSSPLLVMAMT